MAFSFQIFFFASQGFKNIYFQFFCGLCNSSNKLLISIFPKNGTFLFFETTNMKLNNAGLKAAAV